jgi:hypothetical protein
MASLGDDSLEEEEEEEVEVMKYRWPFLLVLRT